MTLGVLRLDSCQGELIIVQGENMEGKEGVCKEDTSAKVIPLEMSCSLTPIILLQV